MEEEEDEAPPTLADSAGAGFSCFHRPHSLITGAAYTTEYHHRSKSKGGEEPEDGR